LSTTFDAINDLVECLDDTNLVTHSNLTFFELEGKENAVDSLFPRIELNVVGFDNNDYVGTTAIQPICYLGLGYYHRWIDAVDTREKSIDRLETTLNYYDRIRTAIFDLNRKKQFSGLNCKGFIRVYPKYSSNIMHEFIENHTSIIIAFALELTEKW